jgi:hypothetical protein
MAASHSKFDEYTPHVTGSENPQVVRITLPSESGPGRSYARELRTVGQALEKFKFSSFKIEQRDSVYSIRGDAPADLMATFSLVQFIRDLVRGSKSRRGANHAIELCYSHNEIEVFDAQERAKRADSKRLPDPYSISQILRGVGAYLDMRQASSLLEITFQDRWLTVLYCSSEGRSEREKQDLDYFYDYWVKMYLRRSNRAKAATPNEPTLYVQWEQDIRR